MFSGLEWQNIFPTLYVLINWIRIEMYGIFLCKLIQECLE